MWNVKMYLLPLQIFDRRTTEGGAAAEVPPTWSRRGGNLLSPRVNIRKKVSPHGCGEIS